MRESQAAKHKRHQKQWQEKHNLRKRYLQYRYNLLEKRVTIAEMRLKYYGI